MLLDRIVLDDSKMHEHLESTIKGRHVLEFEETIRIRNPIIVSALSSRSIPIILFSVIILVLF